MQPRHFHFRFFILPPLRNALLKLGPSPWVSNPGFSTLTAFTSTTVTSVSKPQPLLSHHLLAQRNALVTPGSLALGLQPRVSILLAFTSGDEYSCGEI